MLVLFIQAYADKGQGVRGRSIKKKQDGKRMNFTGELATELFLVNRAVLNPLRIWDRRFLLNRWLIWIRSGKSR